MEVEEVVYLDPTLYKRESRAEQNKGKQMNQNMWQDLAMWGLLNF